MNKNITSEGVATLAAAYLKQDLSEKELEILQKNNCFGEITPFIFSMLEIVFDDYDLELLEDVKEKLISNDEFTKEEFEEAEKLVDKLKKEYGFKKEAIDNKTGLKFRFMLKQQAQRNLITAPAINVRETQKGFKRTLIGDQVIKEVKFNRYLIETGVEEPTVFDDFYNEVYDTVEEIVEKEIKPVFVPVLDDEDYLYFKKNGDDKLLWCMSKNTQLYETWLNMQLEGEV